MTSELSTAIKVLSERFAFLDNKNEMEYNASVEKGNTLYRESEKLKDELWQKRDSQSFLEIAVLNARLAEIKHWQDEEDPIKHPSSETIKQRHIIACLKIVLADLHQLNKQ